MYKKVNAKTENIYIYNESLQVVILTKQMRTFTVWGHTKSYVRGLSEGARRVRPTPWIR